MFIEVMDRSSRKTVLINTKHIISVEDDGEYSIIYLNDDRIICAYESYGELRYKIYKKTN